MGCGYSRGSTDSSRPSKPMELSDLLLPGSLLFIWSFVLYLVFWIVSKVISPPKTKITDYYQPKKNENHSSKGPYKHIED